MKYPKINSLYKREDTNLPKKYHNLIFGEHALPEFGMIQKWHVQEKIDGTNIRIHYYINNGCVDIDFQGRTDDAMIPPHLLKYLQSYFTHERLCTSFDIYKNPDIILFGEGYGPKIQSGGNYRSDVGFILFDIKVGNWWLKQEDVQQIAKELNIPCPPIIGIMNEEEIVAYVKSKPLSLCSIVPQVMEGIIARTDPLLLFRNGDRLMWKLKVKDFR